MKLPQNFPYILNETKVIFAARPKCPSLIHDLETKVTVTISYYALGQRCKCSKVCLFSLDDHFKVVGNEFFKTVEKAMNSLEPDGLVLRDWKFLKH